MAKDRLVPIVVGVGDYKNRSQKVEDAVEPLVLMLEAIILAIEDCGLSTSNASNLQADIDSIDVVRTWTWPYDDLPGLLAQKLGVNPRHKHYAPIHGGNTPGQFFDDAAKRVATGESKVALSTGGEALASLSACVAAKKMPPPGWTKTKQDVKSVFSPSTREWPQNMGALHSVGAPIQVYPLYENGFRAHRKQSIAENHRESTKMYAEFAKVAEKNPYAWDYGKASSEEVIGTVTKRNRMICFPYSLLMNAFNTINLAGAFIITSTKYAEELGIPKHKWIYALGGAGARDSENFWDRPNYYSAPCISRSLDAGMVVSGLTKDDIDLFDFYSCFPIVPKLACEHLGLSCVSPSKPITILGGLTSFGGAGNNYSMHAITEMVRQLRAGKGKNGLVLANGGVATYQHVVCLSSHPRRGGSPYPIHSPLPETTLDVPAPEVDAQAEGEAVIETYTVDFDRNGTPTRGHIVGRLKSNNHRFIANHGDEHTLRQLASTTDEPIGRPGTVRKDTQKQGRNLFSFNQSSKL